MSYPRRLLGALLKRYLIENHCGDFSTIFVSTQVNLLLLELQIITDFLCGVSDAFKAHGRRHNSSLQVRAHAESLTHMGCASVVHNLKPPRRSNEEGVKWFGYST